MQNKIVKENEQIFLELNTMKAYLTIAVVLYHCLLAWSVHGWHDFKITPFKPFEILDVFLFKLHTPTFTVLSGYLFYYLRYEKGQYRQVRKDISRRANRLLIPYLVMLVWVLPFYFIAEKGTVSTAVMKYVLAVAPSQLWYLLMLFGVFVVFYFCSDFVRENNLLYMIVFYLIYGCATLMGSKVPNYFQCWSVLKYLIFFYFGFLLRRGQIKWLWTISAKICMIIYGVLIVIDYWLLWQNNSIIIKAISAALDPFASMLGAFAVIRLVSGSRIATRKETKFLRLLKAYSFPIYLIHQQLVYIPLAIFSDSLHPILLALLCFALSLLGSLAISVLLGKIKVTRKIFGITQYPVG